MILKTQQGNLKIHLELADDFTQEEITKLQKAIRHAAQKLNAPAFKKFCENYDYTFKVCSGWLWWKKCKKKLHLGFKSSKGKTGLQVYNHLMKGKETLSDKEDNIANIHLKVDRRNKKGVLGYTYPNSIYQWVYSWFLKSDYKRVAGNIIHEWIHKMGYTHEWRYNLTRKHTVPYAVGDYVAEIVR